MIKFSLATLLILVLFAAVSCTALVNANDLWRQCMVTAAVATIWIATLAVAVDRSRAFALGFAISGWIYMTLVFFPAIDVRDDLLTNKAIQELFSLLHKDAPSPSDPSTVLVSPITTGSFRARMGMFDLKGARPHSRDYENFADVGHAVWLLIVGLLGGCSARFLIRRPTKS